MLQRVVCFSNRPGLREIELPPAIVRMLNNSTVVRPVDMAFGVSEQIEIK